MAVQVSNNYPKQATDCGPILNQYLDILIIGAGPAGISSSLYLAEKGYSPALIDEAEFPRDKVCGDAISGEGLRVLKSFGLMDAVEQSGRKYNKKELNLGLDNFITMENKAIGLPRKVFDNILLTRAINSGVRFSVKRFTGRIYSKTIHNGMETPAKEKNSTKAGRSSTGKKADGFGNNDYTVEVLCPKTLQKSFITARYIIIATGCQSDTVFSRMDTEKFAKPDQAACRGYYRAAWPVSERKYFFLQELNPGYSWIFPLGNDVFNVGCGGKILKVRKLNLKQCLDEFIQATNKRYTCGGEWLQPPQSAFLRTNFSNLKALKKYPNIILAGESMGSTYPFSGGGIGKALTSGIIAAQAIDAIILRKSPHKTLSEIYTETINKKMKPSYYTAFTLWNHLLTQTPLEKFIYKRVFKSHRSPDVIANILSKKTTPDYLFSLKNILKYLFFK